MALTAIKRRSKLAPIAVLAPERYDPRRTTPRNRKSTVLLQDVAQIKRKNVWPSDDLGPHIVLRTCDVSEGIVTAVKEPTDNIGSLKREVRPHDVIISRLRPDRRQVAFVDKGIPNAKKSLLVVSTEFFILRSVNSQSIAFLVTFLLSAKVQEVLAASQEGATHPRIDGPAVLNLPIPRQVLRHREALSERVEESIRLYRESQSVMSKAIVQVDRSWVE